MRTIIFVLFTVILISSCKKKEEIIKDEPKCGEAFNILIYEQPESDYRVHIEMPENNATYKVYYTACTDELSIDFSFNYVYNNDKLIIPEGCFESKTYIGVSKYAYDGYVAYNDGYFLAPTANDGYYRVFSDHTLTFLTPAEFSIEYNLLYQNYYNGVEVDNDDLKILKIDPSNNKVLEVLPTISNVSANSQNGVITTSISSEGFYAIGSYMKPKFTGNNIITATCSGLVNKSITYNNSLKGGGRWTEPIIGTYTVIQVDYSGSDYTAGGDAWIRFVGYGVETYNLNSSDPDVGNAAQFGYKENNVLKWFKTTGANGSITITKYEDVGGVIEGTVKTTAASGGITNTNKNVNIEASFKVKRTR